MGSKFLFQNQIKQDKGYMNFEKSCDVNLRHLGKLGLEDKLLSFILDEHQLHYLMEVCSFLFIGQASIIK